MMASAGLQLLSNLIKAVLISSVFRKLLMLICWAITIVPLRLVRSTSSSSGKAVLFLLLTTSGTTSLSASPGSQEFVPTWKRTGRSWHLDQKLAYIEFWQARSLKDMVTYNMLLRARSEGTPWHITPMLSWEQLTWRMQLRLNMVLHLVAIGSSLRRMKVKHLKTLVMSRNRMVLNAVEPVIRVSRTGF